MAKTAYINGKPRLVDFDWEAEYVVELQNNPDVIALEYKPAIHFKLFKSTYQPSFLVEYADRYEIIDAKQTLFYADPKEIAMNHSKMAKMPQTQLVVALGYLYKENKPIIYKKVKKVATHGFVDYNWKNPNTISNKRKNKALTLEAQLKEANAQIKDYDRYFKYLFADKLTKQQKEWLDSFINKMKENNNV